MGYLYVDAAAAADYDYSMNSSSSSVVDYYYPVDYYFHADYLVDSLVGCYSVASLVLAFVVVVQLVVPGLL